MSECEFITKCPMFARFKSEGVKNVWILTFCKADHSKCERKKARLKGENVPENMLPNGTFLNS